MQNNRQTAHNSRYLLTNKSEIMRNIILDGPVSRAALAKKVGISIPSTMSITENLINKGLIHYVGKGKSSGGKPPELLAVVADSEYYMGVDIGRGTIRIVIINLGREIIYRASFKTGEVLPAEDFVERLSGLIQNCLTDAQIDLDKLVGIGVAMPGLIERDTGYVLFSPDFEWRDIPLQSWLQMKFAFPVIVENANRALALAEADWRSEQENGENHTILCVNIGHGIGSAIIQNGQLYYGSSGTSGEIGHITVTKDGPLCACGNTGCLEAVASGEAIARQARDALNLGIKSSMRECVGNSVENIDAKMVFMAAKEGDEVALSIFERAMEYIGIGLATAINLLDPDSIVLCGGLTKSGDFFLSKVIQNVQSRQMKQAGRSVSIRLGKRGDYATAIGGAFTLFHNGWRIPRLKHYYSIEAPANKKQSRK